MKILIGADIVPTETNMGYFEQEDTGSLLLGGLKELLDSAEYRIFNLEVPLTDLETPISKCGPGLIASTKSALGLKAIGTDFVTLANNHIMDQGTEGLHCTMRTLQSCGISYAGVGENLDGAAKPFFIKKNGEKIGIYCCAEHEFSIAEEDKPGANPFDPLNSLDHIENLKKQSDYVIVLYHGGKEHYRYPSPILQKVCRKIIDKGADLVICQHTHCIGCQERYLNGTIVYGQGNFLFDDCDNEYWNTSLLISIDTKATDIVKYIPLVKQKYAVALAADDKDKILQEFNDRSSDIQKSGFIAQAYAEISRKEYARYINSLQGSRYTGLVFRILNKLSRQKLKQFLLNHAYKSKDAKNQLINLIECEVHRECFLYALKNH